MNPLLFAHTTLPLGFYTSSQKQDADEPDVPYIHKFFILPKLQEEKGRQKVTHSIWLFFKLRSLSTQGQHLSQGNEILCIPHLSHY
jgi:hypothetical protein